jgi:hypothetical protein
MLDGALGGGTPLQPRHAGGDQASTLRALFAQPACAVLPVLAPARHDAARTRWIAQLAQAFARSGRRTLAVDAARLQVAAALGLRARFDLLHVQRGECPADAAVLDAGPDLAVLPAARAFESAGIAGAAETEPGALLSAAIGAHAPVDLVLLALAPAAAARVASALVGSDWLLPILPDARDLAALLTAVHATAEGMNASIAATSGHEDAIVVFRSLFLGMDGTSASTLADRMTKQMAASARSRAREQAGKDLPIELRFGGGVRTGRDLLRVVQSAAGWDLAQLTLPRTENLESFS